MCTTMLMPQLGGQDANSGDSDSTPFSDDPVVRAARQVRDAAVAERRRASGEDVDEQLEKGQREAKQQEDRKMQEAKERARKEKEKNDREVVGEEGRGHSGRLGAPSSISHQRPPKAPLPP